MNLLAYIKISELSDILSSTGIEISRLRGLTLMKDVTPYAKEDIKNGINDMSIEIAKDMLSIPRFSMNDDTKEKLYPKFFIYDKYGDETYIKWNHIHGKKRKNIKFKIKQKKKAILNHTQTFNKYAGRDDVLCVHARIGSYNWLHYGKDIEKHPAFLEKADDFFDETYCNIYLKIDREISQKIQKYLKEKGEKGE